MFQFDRKIAMCIFVFVKSIHLNLFESSQPFSFSLWRVKVLFYIFSILPRHKLRVTLNATFHVEHCNGHECVPWKTLQVHYQLTKKFKREENTFYIILQDVFRSEFLEQTYSKQHCRDICRISVAR